MPTERTENAIAKAPVDVDPQVKAREQQLGAGKLYASGIGESRWQEFSCLQFGLMTT